MIYTLTLASLIIASHSHKCFFYTILAVKSTLFGFSTAPPHPRISSDRSRSVPDYGLIIQGYGFITKGYGPFNQHVTIFNGLHRVRI